MLEGEYLESFIGKYLEKLYNEKLAIFMKDLEENK